MSNEFGPSLFDLGVLCHDAEEGSQQTESREVTSELVPGPSESIDFVEEVNLFAQVEALVFATPKPLPVSEILSQIGKLNAEVSENDILKILGSIESEYKQRGGGIRLEHLKGEGYQFRTVTAASSLMANFFSSRPRPLSKAALETMAIIAYRQPVTRAEIEYIRGVDSGSIVKNLLERELIVCVGRKEEAGRPMVFGTTSYFLEVFGLGSLKELPPLSSFQPSTEVLKKAEEKLESVDQELNLDGIVKGENFDVHT